MGCTEGIEYLALFVPYVMLCRIVNQANTWRTLVNDGRTLYVLNVLSIALSSLDILSLVLCRLNTSVVVSSVGGDEMRVPVDVSLTWPGLVQERLVTLKPTTVGNTSVSAESALQYTQHVQVGYLL